MADITLTIPPAFEERVIHALCVQGSTPTEPIEETGANAKAAIIEYIKRLVWRVETQEAEAAAAVTAEDGLVT